MDASDRAASASEAVDPRIVLLLGGGLLIAAGLAWAWTVARAAMPDCHQVAFGDFVGMWTVMMAAMMFPAMVPVVLTVATFARGRGSSPLGTALVFVGAYLVVWGALALPARALLDMGAWLVREAPWTAGAAGVVLVACGLYQLTPLKDACLRHCRTPHLFLGNHWRDGLGGALLLGAHHGLYCAGCCASLMLVLLVVGMMDMAWMVGLSGLILLEKVVPGGLLIGRIAGVGLCVAGVARLLG